MLHKMSTLLSNPLLDLLRSLDITTLALVAPASLVVLAHLVPYLWDAHNARALPGPLLAKFSDLWLGIVSKGGHRSETIHQLHLKHGPVLRIAPNHISIADPTALGIIYAHGNGALKSNFYDAFVSIRRGVFNTRDRAEHARKRKIVSHIFSQKSVVEFEPHIRLHVESFIRQWDRLCGEAEKGGKGEEGEGWVGRGGRLWLDCLPWVNYLAFDIVGDLAFGAPFGMISAAKDVAHVPATRSESEALSSSASAPLQSKTVPAVKILNGRGEYSMALGVLPPWWRPLARLIPWYRRGAADVKSLAGIAIIAVKKRLEAEERGDIGGRVDLLGKMRSSRDAEGREMAREELTAEALTLLIAGSDTTSNSTCAIFYHLASHPATQAKLQRELDEQLGSEDLLAATADQVKRLPFLEACINEGLRVHSPSSLGLPRVVPEGGMTVSGLYFPEGTVVSVPSYSIHRDPEVWGLDTEAYRPERWLAEEGKEEREEEKERLARMQRTFNPFSVGPRACVGRNLAFLELQIICASLLRRYEFVLKEEGQQLKTSEGFLRKPLGCVVGIKRRDV
ncbi:hypothetical protein DXG01_013253 [Tephrocybe rancida]|nr:hypothetical protein DXG01_013253 [Tephrocybe rancida]